MESRRRSTQEPEPELLRVSQVARMLSVSKDTVYRMVKAVPPELPHKMVHGMYRIPAAAVKRKLSDDD